MLDISDAGSRRRATPCHSHMLRRRLLLLLRCFSPAAAAAADALRFTVFLFAAAATRFLRFFDAACHYALLRRRMFSFDFAATILLAHTFMLLRGARCHTPTYVIFVV